jgi:hypothetical protein
MSDLRALIEAVDQDDAETVLAAVEAIEPDNLLKARLYWAWLGGLDAAVEIVEHLLPGWYWVTDSAGEANFYRARGIYPIYCDYVPGNPARALLLAALRAKLAEGE